MENWQVDDHKRNIVNETRLNIKCKIKKNIFIFFSAVKKLTNNELIHHIKTASYRHFKILGQGFKKMLDQKQSKASPAVMLWWRKGRDA